MPPGKGTYLERAAARDDVLSIQTRVAHIHNTRKQLDDEIARTRATMEEHGDPPPGTIEEYDDLRYRTRAHQEFLENEAPRLRTELEEVKAKAEQISSAVKATATADLGIVEIQYARKAVMEFLAETEGLRGPDEKYSVAEPGHRDDGILRPNAAVSVERLRTIMDDPSHSQWGMSVVLSRLSALYDEKENLRSELNTKTIKASEPQQQLQGSRDQTSRIERDLQRSTISPQSHNILAAILPAVSQHHRDNSHAQWDNIVRDLSKISFGLGQEKFPRLENAPDHLFKWTLGLCDISTAKDVYFDNAAHRLWLVCCAAPEDLDQLHLLVECVSVELKGKNAYSSVYIARAAERYVEALEEALVRLGQASRHVLQMSLVACRLLHLVLLLEGHLSKETIISLCNRVSAVLARNDFKSTLLPAFIIWVEELMNRREVVTILSSFQQLLIKDGDCIAEDAGLKDSSGRPLRSFGIDLGYFWLIDHRSDTIRAYHPTQVTFTSELGTQEIHFSGSKSASTKNGARDQPFIFSWGEAQDDFLAKHMFRQIDDAFLRGLEEDEK